jgi:hypothetical protein
MEDDATASQPKKHRSGFKVGPDNLPDGTYRRKGTERNAALDAQLLTNLSDQDKKGLDP